MAAKKKVAAKKPVKTAKKTTARKTAAKKAPVAATPVKAIKDPMSKTALVGHLAEATELSKKQVNAVFEELADVIAGHLKKRGGTGYFTLPGLLKVVTKHKPAQKARKGLHPITKEPTMFKAKAASVQVKVRPLKKLKDMAQ